ncbi:MAG: TetR family transcriptional regulator [Caulobacteraceae bacterium]
MDAIALAAEDSPRETAEPALRRGRPSHRGARREALLEGAAAVFNGRGIAATSLAEIAEALGLARASVYYYVDDRAELVFQCYQRACDLVAEDLAVADEAENGLQRVLAFVARALTPHRPPVAVLSEINYLPPHYAEVIRTAHARNVVALIGFIEAGVADGSVRSCDAEVAAQTIVGTLAWAQLSPDWVSERRSHAFRARLSDAMLDLLTHGLSVDRRRRFVCPIDADSFRPGPFNAFDRREASEMKVEQLLAAASRAFNRDGIEAVSLDEITASLGATKGALYHYLRDKADLVTRCYERGFDLFDRFAEAAQNHDGCGVERALVGTHVNVQAQAGALAPLMPQPGLASLPEPRRAALVARARRLNRLFDRLTREGVADGSCRSVDAAMTSLMGAGAFGWLPKWLAPGDPRSPRQLADEISDFHMLGLSAEPGRRS